MLISIGVILVVVASIVGIVYLAVLMAKREEESTPKRKAPESVPAEMVQPLLDFARWQLLKGDQYARERAERVLRDWDIRAEFLAKEGGSNVQL